jgi:hypothetical protein
VQLRRQAREAPLKLRAAPQTQGVDSAELGLLPRLPTPRTNSNQSRLRCSPILRRCLFRQGRERAHSEDCTAEYRIVAFATHGLVPGELNGLTQPALRLTAPNVADVDGDGLLTMEEILALKLDADWVVLSACNTGAASGAARKLLLDLGARSSMPARGAADHELVGALQSARELVTDLFAGRPPIPRSRGEALRAAMIAILDGKGLPMTRQDTFDLRPSVVLGALFHFRRWWQRRLLN